MKFDQLRQREFITLSGSAASWPLAAHAPQSERVRRVGVLWPGASVPPSPRMEALERGLRDAGPVPGRAIEIALRYTAHGLERLREHAHELTQLDVQAIAAFGDLASRAAPQATTSIPITQAGRQNLGQAYAGADQSTGRHPSIRRRAALRRSMWSGLRQSNPRLQSGTLASNHSRPSPRAIRYVGARPGGCGLGRAVFLCWPAKQTSSLAYIERNQPAVFTRCVRFG